MKFAHKSQIFTSDNYMYQVTFTF